jgi:hypothetical protein
VAGFFHKPVEKAVENTHVDRRKLDQEMHLQHLPQPYSKNSLREAEAGLCIIS